MSNPVIWEKIRKQVISLSSVELAQRVVKVNNSWKQHSSIGSVFSFHILVFIKNQGWHFMGLVCLADESHLFALF